MPFGPAGMSAGNDHHDFKGVSKIVKPIRGGGGKRLQTPRSTVGSIVPNNINQILQKNSGTNIIAGG